MTLVAGIATSGKDNEHGLALAARVVEPDEVEVRLDDGATDLRTAVLRGRQRERLAARLGERLGHLGDALDALQDLVHLRRRIRGDAQRDGDLPDLAFLAGELALR